MGTQQGKFSTHSNRDGMQAFDALQKTGIIARPMHGTLKDYIRISVGTKQENDRVIEALKRIQSGFEIS